jgi:hypothetical protein
VIRIAGEDFVLIKADRLHENYVFSTAIHSVWDIVKGMGLNRQLVAAGVRSTLEALMCGVHVLVSAPTSPTVHAWICGEPGTLYFVFVPFELRRQGIASAMVKAVCKI